MKDLSIKTQVIAKKPKKEASRAWHSLCLFFFIHILIYFLKECLKLSFAITSISATVEKYLKEASPVSKNTADFVSLPNPIPSSSDAGKNEWFFYSVLKLA